jgi:hypothetical protein
MPDTEEGAPAKPWVQPWRGPNPIRVTALFVAWMVLVLVGGFTLVHGSSIAVEAPRRSTALVLFGLAAVCTDDHRHQHRCPERPWL